MLWPDLGCRVSWPDRLRLLDAVDVLSTDIFNTLLIQAPRLDAAILDAVGREIPRWLWEARCPPFYAGRGGRYRASISGFHRSS